jgi:hypothetical protein
VLNNVIDIVLSSPSNKECVVELKYLKRALVHAYREYIRSSIMKEASGWRSYTDRIESLKLEILLLNYAINKASWIDFPKEYISKDSPTLYVSAFDLKKILITGKHSVDKKLLIDNIFLKLNRVESKTEDVLPLLDPGLLDPGTVAEGYSRKMNRIRYFIVQAKNDEHVWKNTILLTTQ